MRAICCLSAGSGRSKSITLDFICRQAVAVAQFEFPRKQINELRYLNLFKCDYATWIAEMLDFRARLKSPEGNRKRIRDVLVVALLSAQQLVCIASHDFTSICCRYSLRHCRRPVLRESAPVTRLNLRRKCDAKLLCSPIHQASLTVCTFAQERSEFWAKWRDARGDKTRQALIEKAPHGLRWPQPFGHQLVIPSERGFKVRSQCCRALRCLTRRVLPQALNENRASFRMSRVIDSEGNAINSLI